MALWPSRVRRSLETDRLCNTGKEAPVLDPKPLFDPSFLERLVPTYLSITSGSLWGPDHDKLVGDGQPTPGMVCFCSCIGFASPLFAYLGSISTFNSHSRPYPRKNRLFLWGPFFLQILTPPLFLCGARRRGTLTLAAESNTEPTPRVDESSSAWQPK